MKHSGKFDKGLILLAGLVVLIQFYLLVNLLYR